MRLVVASIVNAVCLASVSLFAACGDGNDAPDGDPVDQAFQDGFEAGYAQGLADAESGAGGTSGAGGSAGAGGARQTLTLAEAALNVGWFEGLQTPFYGCSSDSDCLKGEVCWREGAAFCAPPAACDEPHPDSDLGECQRLCLSRYDLGNRFIPCVANCQCEAHLGDEVACQNDEQCRLPWRPECIGGLCGGEPILADEFYQLVMTKRFCDPPDSVPDGFACE